jgi:ribosome-binding protein aMBF1 (putative translation factor)
MLENNSTNVSGSSECERPFLEEPLEINLRFGARVSALRTQNELSQEELALKLRVSASHLMDLETGRKSASIIDLDGLAQQFKMSIAELLVGL